MIRTVCIVLGVSVGVQVSAFAPHAPTRGGGLRADHLRSRTGGVAVRPNHAVVATPRSAVRKQTQLSMLALPCLDPGTCAAVARWTLAFPALYALMSVNEYFTHRYYQHTGFNKSLWLQAIARVILRKEEVPRIGGGGHVEHHAETLDDMTLKYGDNRYENWENTAAAKMLDADPYRGTAFTWMVTGIMTVQMLPTTLPVFHLLGFSLARTFQILIPGMILHALVWNALHPHMHGLPDVPLRVGVPSWPMAGLRNTKFFRWLYMNHEGHHVVGGQGNYNVACPGTDHLVGTYIPQAEWRPRQAATLAVLATKARALKLAGDLKNKVPQQEQPQPVYSNATTVVA